MVYNFKNILIKKLFMLIIPSNFTHTLDVLSDT